MPLENPGLMRVDRPIIRGWFGKMSLQKAMNVNEPLGRILCALMVVLVFGGVFAELGHEHERGIGLDSGTCVLCHAIFVVAVLVVVALGAATIRRVLVVPDTPLERFFFGAPVLPAIPSRGPPTLG